MTGRKVIPAKSFFYIIKKKFIFCGKNKKIQISTLNRKKRKKVAYETKDHFARFFSTDQLPRNAHYIPAKNDLELFGKISKNFY